MLENPHPLVPVPHEILWFPGGNIVLSTDAYLFKVHKDILSFQSSVFKDMFDFPVVNRTRGNVAETLLFDRLRAVSRVEFRHNRRITHCNSLYSSS